MSSGMKKVDRAGFFSPISESSRKYLKLNYSYTRKYNINMSFRHLELYDRRNS